MKYVGIGVKFHIQFDILLSPAPRGLLRVPQALPEGVSLPFLAGTIWLRLDFSFDLQLL